MSGIWRHAVWAAAIIAVGGIASLALYRATPTLRDIGETAHTPVFIDARPLPPPNNTPRASALPSTPVSAIVGPDTSIIAQQARATAEAEALRSAQLELQNVAAAADRDRRAAEEQRRLAAEDAQRAAVAQQQRQNLAEVEARQAAVAELMRVAAVAENDRLAVEASRQIAEGEARRRADEETLRLSNAAALAAKVQVPLAQAPASSRGSEPQTTLPIATSAAVRTELPSQVATAPKCGPTLLNATPLAGGRSRIDVAMPCHAGERFAVTYGPLSMSKLLDRDGQAAFEIEVLLENNIPVSIRGGDGTASTVIPRALDLDTMTKIAVLWRDPIALELQAYEYAAGENGAGHIRAAVPSSLTAARAQIAIDARGHGYIRSTSSDAGDDTRLQVYSFIHADHQMAGIVAMRLSVKPDPEARASGLCGTSTAGSVPIDVIVRGRDGTVERSSATVAIACSNGRMSGRATIAGAVPDLRLHK